MYSLSWADSRIQEHANAHTRATELLESQVHIDRKKRRLWLAGGNSNWEGWKYLVRMIENAWGIRKNPNTTKHLNSKIALTCLDVILVHSLKSNPKYLLTSLEEYGTLYEQLRVREPGTFNGWKLTIVPDDGQLDLFEEVANDASRVSGGLTEGQKSASEAG